MNTFVVKEEEGRFCFESSGKYDKYRNRFFYQFIGGFIFFLIPFSILTYQGGLSLGWIASPILIGNLITAYIESASYLKRVEIKEGVMEITYIRFLSERTVRERVESFELIKKGYEWSMFENFYLIIELNGNRLLKQYQMGEWGDISRMDTLVEAVRAEKEKQGG